MDYFIMLLALNIDVKESVWLLAFDFKKLFLSFMF